MIAAIDAVLLKAAGVSGDIIGVAACIFWHSLLGLDSGGRPTTSVLMWNDRRSRGHTPQLKARLDEHTVHRRTGAHFHSSFWPAKLLWIRAEQPGVWDATDRWVSFADSLWLRLCGDAVSSVSMASATGIFDQKNCDWDGDLLKFLKMARRKLPRLAGEDEAFRLRPTFAKKWPRLAGARWFPAVGDGAADTVGCGAASSDTAALMIGTSAALRLALAGAAPDDLPEGLWCYRVDRRRVIIGGALSDGGNLYSLICERFGLAKNAGALAARREPADGLFVIPFFFGERSTGYDEDARGAIIGITAAHDGIDVLRAAMEGVAFRLADILDRLEKVAKIDAIVASGGALRESPAWAQLIADTLGRDLTRSTSPESALKGTVLLALESLGKIETIANK